MAGGHSEVSIWRQASKSTADDADPPRSCVARIHLRMVSVNNIPQPDESGAPRSDHESAEWERQVNEQLARINKNLAELLASDEETTKSNKHLVEQADQQKLEAMQNGMLSVAWFTGPPRRK
jgi:hypothetical protein